MIFFPLILRSTVITRFVATMMSLTAASRLATFLRWQLSCVHGTILAWHTTTNHPNILHDRFRVSASWSAAHRVRASPLTSRLAVLLWPNRVHSRCRLSDSFRCSPPRLAATQLLQGLTRNTVPDGRGLPPRRIVTLHSALVPLRRNWRHGGACTPPRRPVISARHGRPRSTAATHVPHAPSGDGGGTVPSLQRA